MSTISIHFFIEILTTSNTIHLPHCSGDIERTFRFGNKTYSIAANTDIAFNLRYLREYNNIWLNQLKYRKENNLLHYKDKELPSDTNDATLKEKFEQHAM